MLEDCPLKRFLDEAQNVSATERGQMLLANEDIVGLHNEAVSEVRDGKRIFSQKARE